MTTTTTTTRGPSTLAGFKRALAAGQPVTLIEAYWRGEPDTAHRSLGKTRIAVGATPKSSVIHWEGGARLDFGPASCWTFDPDANLATFTESDPDAPECAVVLVYRLEGSV